MVASTAGKGARCGPPSRQLTSWRRQRVLGHAQSTARCAAPTPRARTSSSPPQLCKHRNDRLIYLTSASACADSVSAVARSALCVAIAAASCAAPALAEGASGPVDASTYVPWQVYVGAAVGVFPFILGAYEFGKRILIQRRCENCNGIGLVKKGKYYKKCVECGGFFPWLGWKTFFTSTASPGNGGPLLQPRGQTSVLYKVPPVKKARQDESAAAESDASVETRK